MAQHVSFTEVKAGRVFDRWTVPSDLGDHAGKHARAYCSEVIETMREREAPFLLGHVVRDMIEKGQFGEAEISFCQAIAEKLLGVRLNTALPTGIVHDDNDFALEQIAIARPSPLPRPATTKAKLQPVLSAKDELSRLMRLPELTRLLGISRPTVYRLIQNGEFPTPIKQGRTSSWRRSDVLAYLANLTKCGL
jgi:prophage regulatory protein